MLNSSYSRDFLVIFGVVLVIIASDFKFEAMAEKNSRVVTYQGLPVDNTTTTSTRRMTKFLIKSDLKVKTLFSLFNVLWKTYYQTMVVVVLMVL